LEIETVESHHRIHEGAVPFISVLLTCYNYADFIERSLSACKRQSFRDFEVIVVDDCSTDASREVIQSFVDRNRDDLNITFFALAENCGPGGAKDHALQQAVGTYVLFHDCDDWMDGDCLEVLAENARRTEADKIRAQVRTHNEVTGRIERTRRIPSKPNVWAEGMFHATLYKRSLFTENCIRFHLDRDVSDDLYLHALLNPLVKSAEYIRHTVYTLTFKPTSLTGTARYFSDRAVVSLEKTLRAIYPVYQKLNRDDKILCEYLFVKQYYFLLLHFGRLLPWNKLVAYHQQLRDSIISLFHDYPRNENIRFFRGNGDMFSFRAVMWLCSASERFHLTRIMLACYFLLSRILYFSTR